jgi:periplasmic protein TonB
MSVRTGRLSGSLPLSIAVHAVVLLLLFIIPLVDVSVLPIPSALQAPYIQAMAAPPPPPIVRPAPPPSATPPVDDRDLAPTVAPERIVDETPTPAAPMPDLPIGDTTGAPAGLGEPLVGVTNPAVITPPPPIQRPSGPVRVSELLRPPRKTVDVRPLYPEYARVARIEGTVVLEAILDRNGRVDQLRVVKSVPLLDQAALDAVRQWRYSPTVLNGQPVAVLMTITIKFTLQ